MSCCCNNILELCRVSVCGESQIITGADATGNGIYKLVLDYLGVDVIINQEQETGEPLNFPSDGLNENYKYTGKIYDPNGTLVEITLDEIVYNCISFQTGLAYELNPA
jgi:hypothetical protein